MSLQPGVALAARSPAPQSAPHGQLPAAMEFIKEMLDEDFDVMSTGEGDDCTLLEEGWAGCQSGRAACVVAVSNRLTHRRRRPALCYYIDMGRLDVSMFAVGSDS